MSGSDSARTSTMHVFRRLIVAFIAGFVAVLLFHQPVLALLHALGVTGATAYPTEPVPPLEVPRVLSAAFWGGVWGVVFVLVRPWVARGRAYFPGAVLFGAFVLSLVAWFVVAPLKGLPPAGGGNPARIVTALLVNGAWGLGTALLLMLFRQVPYRVSSEVA